MTVNDQLADEAISHAIDLNQYSAGVARRVIALLNRSDSRITAEIALALGRLDPESFTVARLEQLLVSVQALNDQIYRAVFAAIETDLEALAAHEAVYQYDLFADLLPMPVQVAYPLVAVTPQQAYAAALSRPFQGRLLREWAAKMPADRMAVIRNTIRQGYTEGKTAVHIVHEIRGSKSQKYADGALQRSRRELMAVVNTAVSHTASVARDLFVESNADLIGAVEWLSTLDTKTSPPCMIRDGKRYTADQHKPIGHKIPWGDGPGRIHFNCRSTYTPVTKSWRELGIDADELTATERASMDGQVPADTTFATWLSRQSAARQDQVLGPMRVKMMRDGGMKLPEFYDSKGQWIPLDELTARSRR